MANNNWFVITGGPSTGKTTLLGVLEKLGYTTVPEAARVYIDQQLAKGLAIEKIRADEEKFQNEILKLKNKIEKQYHTEQLTFFDRGMHDTLAYLRHYKFKLDDQVKDIIEKSSYQKVFLLEPLPVWVADYARTESREFTKHLHQLLYDAYTEFGMQPVMVPAISPDERAEFVLNHLKKDQRTGV